MVSRLQWRPDGFFYHRASRFNTKSDGYGDVIAPGAYAKTLLDHRDQRSAPAMLWSHDPSEIIGKWVSMTEDGAGLAVKGQLNLDVQRGREALALLKSGAFNGLSIGFRVPRGGATYQKDGSRLLKEIELGEVSIVAMPKTTQWLIDDAAFDIEAFLQANISDEFAVQEGAAFVNGSGNTKPNGYLTSTITNEIDSVRAFGTVQYTAAGGASDFAASSPSDLLINLAYSLRPPYRAGSGVAWMMNNTTSSKIRQFKDDQGATSGPMASPPASLRRCLATLSASTRTCPTSAPTPSRWRSATGSSAIASSIGSAPRSCAIRTRKRGLCCSTQKNALAVLSRTQTRSSCSRSRHPNGRCP
jgi:HK97 family phage prohead protease